MCHLIYADECRHPIPFRVDPAQYYERWIPTLFLPLFGNVLAVENRLEWNGECETIELC